MNRAAQLSAAQRAYDNQCDCCDHEPREPAPIVDVTPYADTYREWVGMESRRKVDYRVIGTGWFEGAPF